MEDGRGETWSCHVRSIRGVTVTITDLEGPTPKCDVNGSNPLPRTTKNEPRNCIDIESDFGFKGKPQVFSVPFSISYQEEHFASGFTSVRYPHRKVCCLEGHREAAHCVL